MKFFLLKEEKIYNHCFFVYVFPNPKKAKDKPLHRSQNRGSKLKAELFQFLNT